MDKLLTRSTTSRRGFLRMFGGAAGAAIVAPTVTHFLPPIGGWLSQRRIVEIPPLDLRALRSFIEVEPGPVITLETILAEAQSNILIHQTTQELAMRLNFTLDALLRNDGTDALRFSKEALDIRVPHSFSPYRL